MKPLRLHILYEHSPDLRPHGTSFLRLIRPLSHPQLADKIEMTCGVQIPSDPVDAVIVDRMWHPGDMTPQIAENLCEQIYRSGARMIYAFDDYYENMSLKVAQRKNYADIFNVFLSGCHGALVTTPFLAQQYTAHKANIQVVSNALDERLLVRRRIYNRPVLSDGGPWVIGVMGTLTHDDDLRMVIPALCQLSERFKNHVLFDFIGVLNDNSVNSIPELAKIPMRITIPANKAIEYPLFMLWYTSQVRWDVAIAPLENIPFNEAKSDIKVLDYSAIGAAGVYSHCPAYQNTIQHGQNGLLVDNDPAAWLEALTKLLTDDQLRFQIQQQADQYLYSERIVARQAHQWVDAIQNLLAYGAN